MSDIENIQLFENQPVRTAWNEEEDSDKPVRGRHKQNIGNGDTMLYVVKLLYAWLLPPGLFILKLGAQ